MVGVPGRSKACSTCRRRKKGCDFQRPSCSQCRRAGLECGGYERGRIFVHTTQHNPSALVSVRESSATPGSSSDVGAIGSNIRSRATNTGGRVANRHSPGRYARTSPRTSPRASPGVRRMSGDLRIVPVQFGDVITGSPGSDSSLIGSAREELLLATFWESYLPNSSMFPSQATGYASGGWTNVVQSLYRKDPVLHYTLMANCFSAVARRDNSRAMAEQSLRAHGRALRELRLALNHPQKARSDSVFSALRLMIVFSMFFSDRYEEDRRARARGWKEHNSGVLALLQARGPEAHISGHGHQMFVDCRLALIVAAIQLRRRSPLNHHKWMTIPWTEIPKTPKDQLIDIICGIPSILEGVDWLKELPEAKGREEFRKKVVNTCWSYDRQLRTWYDATISVERLQALEQKSANQTLSTEELSLVYIMLVFCTTCVLLYSSMHTLKIPKLPPRANVSMYIHKIARYLKVFFHPSTGQYGLEMTSFPLGLCLQILSSNFPTGGDPIEERAMFTRLLETERGREILDFLRSMLNTNETTKK